VLLAIVAAALLTACQAASATENGRTVLSMWTHSAGNPAELEVLDQIIADYNGSQDEYVIRVEPFPQAAYSDALIGAATTGDLPCLLDLDGPNVPNWAWSESLAPLDLPKAQTDQFLPSTLSIWNDEIYAIGYWDAALSVMARRSVLEEHDIRIPSIEEPWTRDEFEDALNSLAEDPDFQYAIDLGASDTGEWWPYAYSPFLQSFGGDLIDRNSFTTAEGALNGPQAMEFASWFRSLFTRPGWSTLNPTPGREDFPLGNAALSWNGNWAAPRAFEEFGDDVLFLPPPDLGNGPVIGGASWQWAISADCEHLEAARDYIELSIDPEYIAAFSENTGLIPATQAAADLTEDYGPGGRLAVMRDISEQLAVIRPPTPAYPVIASVFEKALRDVANGAQPEGALGQAVDQIDTNISSNDNYGF
jgi:multiple sugar transport system substrate-binding protein